MNTTATPAARHAFSRRLSVVLATSAVALGLMACNKAEEPTAGQRLDSAVEKADQAAQQAKQKMEAAATSVESAAQQAGDAARSAASDAAAVMDDAGITAKVKTGLAQDAEISALQIDVDTKSGVVTLNGSVKSEQASMRASQIAKDVQGVQAVVNHLTVSAGG